MLRRSSSRFLRGHNDGHGKIRVFFCGLNPPRNNQHDVGVSLQQISIPASSARCPVGQQSTLGEEDPGTDSFVLRGCKPSGYDVRRPGWQDFQLYRSNFGPQFPKLCLLHNAQFRADFPPIKGRHYAVPAYQDSDEQSEFEISDLKEFTNLQLKLKAPNSGSAALGDRHNGMVVAHETGSRGFAKLSEQDWRPPAPAKDLSELTTRMPTEIYVCKVLQRQNDPELAWQFFLWAGQQEGYSHSNQTYNAMLLTFCTFKKFKAVHQLLETMQRNGFYLNSVACLHIIQSLTDEKKYEEAIRIFETATSYNCRTNIAIYNCYLNVLVKARHFDKVDVALAEMRATGDLPTIYTYMLVINGFGKAEQVERACRVYDEMKAQGCAPGIFIYNTLLRTLVMGGKTNEALELFSEIIESDVVPTLSTYRILGAICGWGGRNYSTFNALKQIKNSDSDLPHANKCNFLIPVLCKERNLGSVLRLLREMESRRCIPSISVYNLVLSSLWRSGWVDAVIDLFKHLKEIGCTPDNASYSTVINVQRRAGNLEEALRLHKEMVAQGLASSTWLCNTLIDCLAKSGQVDRALEFFSQMQECKPDAYTYNILMSTLWNAKNPQNTLAWFKRAGITSEILTSKTQGGLCLLQRLKDVPGPHHMVYNTFVNMLCHLRNVDDAYILLLDMRTNGLVPGRKAYGKVLELLGNSGQVNRAWKLFLEMNETNADLNTYSLMIKFLAKAGSFPKAWKLLKDMKSRGIAPDTSTYRALIDSLGRAGRLDEMFSLFEEMKGDGCKPGMVTYNSLLFAFVKAGQVDRAYKLFEESTDNGCIPDAFSYNAIIRGYFESNRTEEALDLYNVMKNMGCVENEVTSRIVLTGLSKVGLTDMACKVLAEKRQFRRQDSTPFLK